MKIFNFEFKLDFLKSVFSEPDGTGSCSRILMTAIVGFVLGAGTTLVYKIHQPVTVTDLCTFLGTAGTFILSTAGPLYGMNKLADVMKNNSDNKRREE